MKLGSGRLVEVSYRKRRPDCAAHTGTVILMSFCDTSRYCSDVDATEAIVDKVLLLAMYVVNVEPSSIMLEPSLKRLFARFLRTR